MEEHANTPEKKLYVDEDWKAQVEREREEAQPPQQEPAAAVGDAGARAADFSSVTADLSFLIGMLFTQGAMALGILPNPMTNSQEVHRDQAKFAIDLLSMLQQKTEGNRTSDESEDLETAVHQLRLAFVGAAETPKP